MSRRQDARLGSLGAGPCFKRPKKALRALGSASAPTGHATHVHVFVAARRPRRRCLDSRRNEITSRRGAMPRQTRKRKGASTTDDAQGARLAAPAPRGARRKKNGRGDAKALDALVTFPPRPQPAPRASLRRPSLTTVERYMGELLASRREVVGRRDQHARALGEPILLSLMHAMCVEAMGATEVVMIKHYGCAKGHEGDLFQKGQQCPRLFQEDVWRWAERKGVLSCDAGSAARRGWEFGNYNPFVMAVSRKGKRLNPDEELLRLCGWAHAAREELLAAHHRFMRRWLRAISAVKGEQVLVLGSGVRGSQLAAAVGQEDFVYFVGATRHGEIYRTIQRGIARALKEGQAVACVFREQVIADCVVLEKLCALRGIPFTGRIDVLYDLYKLEEGPLEDLRRERSAEMKALWQDQAYRAAVAAGQLATANDAGCGSWAEYCATRFADPDYVAAHEAGKQAAMDAAGCKTWSAFIMKRQLAVAEAAGYKSWGELCTNVAARPDVAAAREAGMATLGGRIEGALVVREAVRAHVEDLEARA
eukprot:CAMPEP_0119269174 /NCGR_PEP_ID=MMETSP1329-20130426/6686_1 /TAXON_ID=114041 /ORGANISM="Genus nov. species nov., Strain RCC1024" /LENGTH=536 /DNA_ID=CAMNT_0007269167 /DNA_START=65 /DNA_END=1672 /DNA_ORIENTATION=+